MVDRWADVPEVERGWQLHRAHIRWVISLGTARRAIRTPQGLPEPDVYNALSLADDGVALVVAEVCNA